MAVEVTQVLTYKGRPVENLDRADLIRAIHALHRDLERERRQARADAAMEADFRATRSVFDQIFGPLGRR
jgi:hypothetical protein